MPSLIELRKQRRELRAAADETLQRIEAGDASTDEFDTLVNELEQVEARIAEIEDGMRVDTSMRPGAGGIIRGNAYGDASGSIQERASNWYDTVTGREVRVIPAGQPLAAPGNDGPSLGSLARAMVLGPRNDVERRALSEGTDSAGGFTVPDPLAADFIDLLRARSHVVAAGAQTVEMTSDTLKIARWAGDPTVAWRNENAAVAESDPTIGQVAFGARSLAVLFRASRELLADSANIDEMIQNGLAKAFADELDRVALFGSGTAPEPTGIVNVTGIGSISMGTNGAALTGYTEILQALQALEDANAEPPTAMIMAPRTRYALAGLTATDNQPLRAPDVVQAVPMLTSSKVPVDETQGTASNASRIVMGDFRELLIGLRQSLRIEVLRERYADSLQFGFVAHARADIQVAHAGSFAEVVGIIP